MSKIYLFNSGFDILFGPVELLNSNSNSEKANLKSSLSTQFSSLIK
jgi:hypothetical protein